VSDLTIWLRAQLDEDERVAREASRYDDEDSAEWDIAYRWVRHARHRTAGGSRHHFAQGAPSPARVLAEVDAKRRIIAEYERYAAERRRAMNGWESSREVSPILAALALPYADRPGYRSEWAPDALT
jgi:hypothetical protein